MSAKNKTEKKDTMLPFTMNTRVTAVFIKFYAEQCGYQPPNNIMTSASISAQDRTLQCQYMCKVLRNIIADNSLDCDVYAIIHDSDTYCNKAVDDTTDDNIKIFCSPAIEKPHAHLVLVVRGKENNGQGRTRPRRTTIGAIIQRLATYGLIFRINSTNKEIAESDMKLLLNQGLIRLDMQKKQHIRTIVYLTHETNEAYETDGKVKYDRSLVFTNNIIEFENAHTYYANFFSKSKCLKSDVAEYQLKFKNAGQNLQDFMSVWNDVPYELQTVYNRKNFKMHYNDGLDSVIDKIPPFPKCCIFLYGKHNVGKTYNTKRAFEMLGIKTFECPATGTGKYDDLQLTHQAFIANDTTSLPDILNLCDDKPSRLYRRNSGNPLFLGNYVVITSNKCLKDWCLQGYTSYSQEQLNALMSRLIDVYVDDNRQVHITLNNNLRGDTDNAIATMQLFNTFMVAFQQSISSYVPVLQQISLQSLAQIYLPDVINNVTFIS